MLENSRPHFNACDTLTSLNEKSLVNGKGIDNSTENLSGITNGIRITRNLNEKVGTNCKYIEYTLLILRLFIKLKHCSTHQKQLETKNYNKRLSKANSLVQVRVAGKVFLTKYFSINQIPSEQIVFIMNKILMNLGD